MAVEIITKDDLEQTKQEIIREMRMLITKQVQSNRRLLKAKDVMKMLNISSGTLQNLRINGTLPYSMVGGLTYYVYEDILKIIEKNMKNRIQEEENSTDK